MIEIEAPTFRDTAHNVYSQQDFWKFQPDLESTALDMVSLAIEEACQGHVYLFDINDTA